MVIIVIMMLMVNTDWFIIPWLRPIPAIISATSPRGIIPMPILVLCNILNLKANAGSPDPNTLVSIATTDINNPATKAVCIELTSTNMPMTTKNTGTRKFLIGSILCSSFSLI